MGAPKEVFYHNPPDLPTFLSQNTLHKNTHEKMGVSDALDLNLNQKTEWYIITPICAEYEHDGRVLIVSQARVV